MLHIFKKYAVLIAWVITIFATAGSLFYSEILKLPPCVLCWYQRIFMYPLVLIIGVGMVKKDKIMPLYVLIMSGLGGAIALFHYLLQMGIIPDKVAPCVQGISCTSRLIEYFGFITIPFMSLVAFVAVFVLILMNQKDNNG